MEGLNQLRSTLKMKSTLPISYFPLLAGLYLLWTHAVV